MHKVPVSIWLISKKNNKLIIPTRFVYLVELPGKGRGFLLPPSWILHVSRTTLAGVQGLARAIAQSL